MSQYARKATLAASIDELTAVPGEMVLVADILRHRKLFAEMIEAWQDDASLEKILEHAARCAALACCAPMAKVLEVRPTDNCLIVKAQYGMGREAIGRAAGIVDTSNPAGEALARVKAIVDKDVRLRPADTIPKLFIDYQVVTSVNLPLINRDGAYGILEVDYREETHFGSVEMSFLASVASALAESIEKYRTRSAIAADRDAKVTLLREQQHRIRNNFQVIVGMLQLNSVSAKDPQVRGSFKEVERRVFAMASIYDHLLGLGENGERVDLGQYLGSMAESFDVFYDLGRAKITLEVDLAHGVVIDLDTCTAIGTVVNELVANAVEHAFDRQPGRIRISLMQEPTGGCVIHVEDDGRGFPVGSQENIGLRTSRRMVAIIGAKLIHRASGSGTTWDLHLPAQDHNGPTSQSPQRDEYHVKQRY
ncbi:sensor histidine kinase [Caballeronia grimmiae]|uniref:sensor histidine kinase n=1 Tax=Caballeronia grimmiae TaxID=1071679 RepID=UPI0038BD566A